MLCSILRSTLMAAVVIGLSACDGDPLSHEPIDRPTAVFTESVLASVDGTIGDATGRLLPALDDDAYAATLSGYLDALNSQLAMRDIVGADATMAQARALLARTDLSLEVQDFAADLSAIELLLDHTEILIDQAAGRAS